MKFQLIAHNGKGRGSKFIRWATRGKYSHISVRIIDMPEWLILWALDEYGYVLTIDHEFESIQGAGVRHQPFKPSNNQGWYELWKPLGELELARLVKEACRLVGCKYDWRGIGGFLTRRNKQNPAKWFCSELACHLLTVADRIVMVMPCHWINPNVNAANPIFYCVRSVKT